jgi:outer membrane protein assembly factor BamE (lipoprotein component of BamABCDE complex)
LPGIAPGNGPARTAGSSRLARLFVFLTALATSACIIPVPRDHDSGRVIKDDPLTIQPGSTTQAEVRRRLGDPNVLLPRDGVYAYLWEHVSATIVIIFAGGGSAVGGAFDISSQEMLLIQFDKDGLVRRVERTRTPRGEKTGQFLQAWAQEG